MYFFSISKKKQAVLRGKKVPQHCLRLERWQDPDTYKQSKTAYDCIVLQFIQS